MADESTKKSGLLGSLSSKLKEAVNTEQGQKLKNDLEERAKVALGGIGNKLKSKLGGEKHDQPENRPSAPSQA